MDGEIASGKKQSLVETISDSGAGFNDNWIKEQMALGSKQS